jgi:hypothetical protein
LGVAIVDIACEEDEGGMLRVAPVKILLTKIKTTRGAAAAARANGWGFRWDGRTPRSGPELRQAERLDYEGKSWEEIAVEIGVYEVNDFGFLQGVRS